MNSQIRPRVAIVGSGISGLTAAYRLQPHVEVTVFEQNDWIGGHTHTVDVELDGMQYAVDTGFIVFNEWTYPRFLIILPMHPISCNSGACVISSADLLGWIIPINLFDRILSLIMSIYLGSNIFRGTVVFGKIIKLLNGNTETIFGKSSFFIFSIYHI